MEGREQEMKVQKKFEETNIQKWEKKAREKKTNSLGSHKGTNLVVYWVPKGL